MEPDLNLATVWEAVAATAPEHPALVHGDRTLSWRRFEDDAARLAAYFDRHGIGHDSKVAVLMRNRPEYLVATFAAFKVRAVPVNVNYRYLADELTYLLENSDAEAIVFHAEFAERVDQVRGALPMLQTFVCVGADAAYPVPDWAEDLDAVLAAVPAAPPVPRSGDDLWFLYTGGTTGMPKGVMWPHRNLLAASAATFKVVGLPVPRDADEVVSAVRAFHDADRAVRVLPAAPLMHGTSAIVALGVLSAGGTVLTLGSPSFDGHELCAAVQRHRVSQLTIVGDAFARPVLSALAEAAAAGNPYDLSSLKVIVSSGVMWSKEAKEELLERCSATLADTLGSSEGVGFAASVTKPGSASETARFRLGEHAAVFTEDGRRVEPGSGERGLLAVGGPIPIGYYKDPAKSAATFRTFDGRVWSVPGDYAVVEGDGTIRLLGRGSACINTAGEKVYPEEVEETLKLHPAVRDANVVGLPDERWGQAVVAVVELEPDVEPVDEDALVAHAKQHLAGYKCPKRVVFVDRVQRGPNGKPDHRWAAQVAAEALGRS